MLVKGATGVQGSNSEYSVVPFQQINFIPNPYKRHLIFRPWGRCMGVVWVFTLWLSSFLVAAMLYTIQCYIGPLYNGTQLYFDHSHGLYFKTNLFTVYLSSSTILVSIWQIDFNRLRPASIRPLIVDNISIRISVKQTLCLGFKFRRSLFLCF